MSGPGGRPAPHVSAAVVNYNTRDHLLACVASLRADGVEEVVVADNASADGSGEALAAADPGVRFFSTGSNLGFGAAANRAVAVAWADYVLLLNPDTVVEPGTAAALAAALDRDPALGAVGPRVDRPDGSLYPSARRFPDLGVALGHGFVGLIRPGNRFSRNYQMADADHTVSAEVDWVSGTAMLVRRSAFEAVGGFDEHYFMYVEDVDLCWRLRQRGWKIGYEPAGRVTHEIGASSRRTPYRMIAAHHRSLFRFARTTTTGSRRALLPVIGLGLALRTAMTWAGVRWPPSRTPPEGH